MTAETPDWADLGMDEPPTIDGRDAVALADADDHIRARNWHLARIAEAEQVYRIVVERAAAALKQTRAKHEPRALWHEHTVIQLHRALLAEDSGRKTVVLPHGTMRARKRPDVIDADPDVTLPWLVDHMPDLVRRQIDKASLNRAVKQGADIPGVAVTPGDVQFSITVDLGEVSADGDD